MVLYFFCFVVIFLILVSTIPICEPDLSPLSRQEIDQTLVLIRTLHFLTVIDFTSIYRTYSPMWPSPQYRSITYSFERFVGSFESLETAFRKTWPTTKPTYPRTLYKIHNQIWKVAFYWASGISSWLTKPSIWSMPKFQTVPRDLDSSFMYVHTSRVWLF